MDVEDLHALRRLAPPGRRRARRAPIACVPLLAATLGLGPTATAAEQPGRRTVLVLQSFGRDFSPFNAVEETFRSELVTAFSGDIDIIEVPLTSARADLHAADEPLIRYLEALCEGLSCDLVVPLGGPAARFVLDHRPRLLPATPLLLLGADRRLLSAADLAAADAVVTTAQNPRRVATELLALLPDTRRLVVVIGCSPLERFWRAELERDLHTLEARLEVEYLSDLPLGQMLERAARLPPRSAILYTVFLVDGAGVPHTGRTVLKSLNEVAAAPVFGLFSSQVGEGAVGGSSLSVEDLGRLGARAAGSLLRGEPPPDGRLVVIPPGAPTFDHRELRRWRIAERMLPPGSIVRHRPEPVWDTHRGPILATLSLIGVLGGLVVALVVNQSRRRRAQREVQALNLRLLSAQEDERRWVARELHDDFSQRLARLSLDAARIGMSSGNSAQVHELEGLQKDIVDLSRDVHTLSRRLHPALLDDLGLVEALRVEIEQFVERHAIDIDTAIEEPLPALDDSVGLCLFRIAQASLRNVALHAGAHRVEISLRAPAGLCELSIRDDGVGFDPSARRASPSVGLASMRERARLAGGRLEIDSAPGRGTSVVVRVPLRPEAS